MSLYFDHPVQTAKNSGLIHSIIQWHPKHPILAVASYHETAGGELNFFFEEGTKTTDQVIRKVGQKICSLAWHPVHKLIAIGWSNGDITVANQENQDSYTVSISPGTALNLLHWSSEGSRLLIVDEAGLLLIHKSDFRGKLQPQPFSKNLLKEGISAIVIRPPVQIEAGNVVDETTGGIGGDDALDIFGLKRNVQTRNLRIGPVESSTFFLGGKQGGVFCIRESGLIQESFNIEKPIAKLLYYKERNILVTVAEDLTVCQHGVSIDCTMHELMKVKLSGRVAHQLDICWIGTATLAFATGEKELRMWDLATEENFVLRLSPEKGYGQGAQGDTIISVAFAPLTNMIAAGTTGGHVAMWRAARARRETDEEPERRWRLQAPPAPQGFHGPIEMLQWSPAHGLLGVGTKKEVFILGEQIMCCGHCDKYAAVQIAPNEITVINLETQAVAECKPIIPIKGIALL